MFENEPIADLNYDIPCECRFCLRYFDGVCEKNDGVNYDPFEPREPNDSCDDFIESSSANSEYQEEMCYVQNDY